MSVSKVKEIHRQLGGPIDVECTYADSVWVRDSGRAAVNPNRSPVPIRAHWPAMPELFPAAYRRFGGTPLGYG
jgi:hypothetical protein